MQQRNRDEAHGQRNWEIDRVLADRNCQEGDDSDEDTAGHESDSQSPSQDWGVRSARGRRSMMPGVAR